MEKQTKTCSHCGKELPLDQFCKSVRSKDGLQAWCKECSKEANRLRNLRKELRR